MEPYILVYGIIIISLILFFLNTFRYDVVALIALLFLAIFRVIPPLDIFKGFAHPAIWTIIGVLIISRGLINSGVINIISRKLDFVGTKLRNQIIVLNLIVGFVSGFINNVGALASFIPVAINFAKKTKKRISKYLIPLAFASLLGGMITMIGSPPNIIIALFRAEVAGQPFRFFDFFPVGIGVAIVGIFFISFIGWKLVPVRKSPIENEPEIKNYKAEILIKKESKAKGKTIGELLKLSGADVEINSIIQKKKTKYNPSKKIKLQQGNVLIVTGSADEIAMFVDVARLKYSKSKKFSFFSDKEIVVEAVVSSGSLLINKKIETIFSRKRYNVNILSVACPQKKKTKKILSSVLREGDVIVLQGTELNINKAISELNCHPLKERGHRFGKPPRIFSSLAIFIAAIVLSAFNIFPVEIAFMTAAILMILLKLTTIKESYSKSIDWSIIVLIGAMIPIGLALEYTGGAKVIVDSLSSIIRVVPIWVVILLLMLVTMLLSNILNNATTAILMAPLGVEIAQKLSVSMDPFLMAIAVSASASFLTPLGHQSNTLVLSQGGYKFKDYWKLGLPLSIIVLIVSIPLILYFWPL